jgi:hypothetical protein
LTFYSDGENTYLTASFHYEEMLGAGTTYLSGAPEFIPGF